MTSISKPFALSSIVSLFGLAILATPLQAQLPRFEPQVIDDQVGIGYGIAVGDVDGDGNLDLILVDKTEISWFSNPQWTKHTIAKNLTVRDNVCVAVADLDGDGKVEIAVGAQWNPGETTDPKESGAVFYLQRPAEADALWTPVALFHDPTTHRMRWVPTSRQEATLVVLPLHGIGNKNGTGENTVQVRAYHVDPKQAFDDSAWSNEVLGAKLHVTHNLDFRDGALYIGGAEGVVRERLDEKESVHLITPENSTPPTRGIGEIAVGADFIAAVEPFHGNDLVAYREKDGTWIRTLISDELHHGHALGVGDFNGDGLEDIVVGWRNPDAEGHVGVKLYYQKADGSWERPFWVARDLVAAEDLKVADFDKDGRLDIAVAGRSTNNLVIFWNRE